MNRSKTDQESSILRAGQVVGSLVDAVKWGRAGAAAVGDQCDIVEFRVEALGGQMGAVAEAMAACPLPVLLTVRAEEEGGLAALDGAARRAIFAALLPQAALVDVELAHFGTLSSVVAEARERGIPVVASFHDFAGTASLAALESLVGRAQEAGAAAVKFATFLRGSGDLAVLAALQESAPLPLATMGMGPLGRVSRLLLASLGSVLNYGYLDQPTVAGQWSAPRLRELLRELSP